MRKIKILLVDDSAQFLRSATSFLSQCPSVEVIGTATSGKDAIKKVQELRPDLVLMDIAMPEMNGLKATRSIKANPRAPKIIIVTIHDDAEYRSATKDAGADGFARKSNLYTHLLPMIHALFGEPAA
ncbi:MAG: response regulator transcription factor [Deltaproteobacteria bacterium]|nr:response regulator transcription factor [Deltaproteobacteria bacterium]